MGPFEVIQVIKPIDYYLDLPANLSKLHNIFYVSLLKKYVLDPTHVLDLDKLQMIDSFVIKVKTMRILDTHTKTLQNHEVE